MARQRLNPLLLRSKCLVLFLKMGLLLVCLVKIEGGNCVHPVDGLSMLTEASEADCDSEICLTLGVHEAEHFSYSDEPSSLELTPIESCQKAAATATSQETEHVTPSKYERVWEILNFSQWSGQTWVFCIFTMINMLLFYISVVACMVTFPFASKFWDVENSDLLDTRLHLILKMREQGARRVRILKQVQCILTLVSKVHHVKNVFSYAVVYLDPVFDDRELDDALVDCRRFKLNVAAAAAATAANRVDLIHDIVLDLPQPFQMKWVWYMYSDRSKWPSLKQYLDICEEYSEDMTSVPFQISTMVRSMNIVQLDDDSADLLEFLLSGSLCQPHVVQDIVECSVRHGLSRHLQVFVNTNGKVNMREGVYAFNTRVAPVLTELVRHACQWRNSPQSYPHYADFTACLSLAVRNGLFTEPLPHKWWRDQYRLLARGVRPGGFGPRSDHETVMGTAMSAAALHRQADIVTLLHRVGAATNKEMHALSQYYAASLVKHVSSCSLTDCHECRAATDLSSLMSRLAGTPRSLLSLTAQVIAVHLIGQSRNRENNVQRLPVPTRLRRQILFEDALDDFYLQRCEGSRVT